MHTIGAALLSLAPIVALTLGETVLVQYTPDQADWSTFQDKATTNNRWNDAHDPDSVGWISASAWEDAAWDGTVYNPSQMSHSAFVAAICPSVDMIRGIREVFYAANPFADNAAPTKAEVDEWHRIALNHARALIGYTSADRQAVPDICMHARALWGDERKFTTMWDAAYPGTTGSAYGPCQGSGNAHCGATFIPTPEDQAPYLPDGHPPCTTQQGSEGVLSGPKANIPWSLKWSRGLCNTLHAEGFWGGHTGPFFHRERFGFSFWDTDQADASSHAVLRGKWTGSRMENLYCNPTDPDCDPNNTGPGPTTSEPTPAPTSYCPAGYDDVGVRWNWGLGKVTIATSHQACADRCNQYSAPQYMGGCKGYQTGMYFGMLYCRSYGGEVRTTPCAWWALPTSPGVGSGELGSTNPRTNQVNNGGNCCSNATFARQSTSG